MISVQDGFDAYEDEVYIDPISLSYIHLNMPKPRLTSRSFLQYYGSS